MQRVEQAFGVLTWLAAPIFLAWSGAQAHASATCINATCATAVSSAWQDHPAELAIAVGTTFIVGALLAALIYSHSVSTSGGLLAVMWLLVPVLMGAVILFAFTRMGAAAGYYGVFMLLAALVGSGRQLLADRFPPLA